ncbi:MAG TPA: type II toxin-antitoxin system VapC family toxin [Thermodesulfovibrionales bacterium]|nr:type II toxin-antitoxin system VapC family toxin [Thermodesulfovibrionales bacterium]
MILYLGTSSLAKLYIEEEYSNIVRGWVRQAEIVSTCRIAYTEMISSLDKRLKKHDLSQKDYDMIVKRFSHDWLHYAIVDFDEREAGLFIQKYGLRRFDAIHLSAAKLIQKQHKDIHLVFSSANEILCNAVVAEGIHVLTYQ